MFDESASAARSSEIAESEAGRHGNDLLGILLFFRKSLFADIADLVEYKPEEDYCAGAYYKVFEFTVVHLYAGPVVAHYHHDVSKKQRP